MKTLRVELGPRSYPIHIGPGLLGRADLVLPHLAGRQVLVVTNEVVAPLYLERALAAFAGLETTTVVLPDGEAHKNLESLTQVFDALLEPRDRRRPRAREASSPTPAGSLRRNPGHRS